MKRKHQIGRAAVVHAEETVGALGEERRLDL